MPRSGIALLLGVFGGGGLGARLAEQRELRALLARADGDGILVGEARVAKAALPLPGQAAQACEGEVAERVGADDLADLLRGATMGDQLPARAGVDPVVA